MSCASRNNLIQFGSKPTLCIPFKYRTHVSYMTRLMLPAFLIFKMKLAMVHRNILSRVKPRYQAYISLFACGDTGISNSYRCQRTIIYVLLTGFKSTKCLNNLHCTSQQLDYTMNTLTSSASMLLKVTCIMLSCNVFTSISLTILSTSTEAENQQIDKKNNGLNNLLKHRTGNAK